VEVGFGGALDEAALRLRVEFPSSFIWFPNRWRVLFWKFKESKWLDGLQHKTLDYYFYTRSAAKAEVGYIGNM
jgi:hypothetical protein